MIGIRRVGQRSESNQGNATVPLANLLEQVQRWRREVGIYSEADEGRLLRLLEDMQEVGIPNGLAVFIMVGCEWGFRIKTVDRSRKAREGLIRQALQQAGSLFHQTQSSLVPEAQAILDDLTTRVGPQVANALAPALIPKRTDLPTRVLAAFNLPVPQQPGTIPWPAPLIASCVLWRIIEVCTFDKDKAEGLVVRLVYALKNKWVEAHHLRARRRQLEHTPVTTPTWGEMPLLEWMVNEFCRDYVMWKAGASTWEGPSELEGIPVLSTPQGVYSWMLILKEKDKVLRVVLSKGDTAEAPWI